jgi:hypothetical protein
MSIIYIPKDSIRDVYYGISKEERKLVNGKMRVFLRRSNIIDETFNANVYFGDYYPGIPKKLFVYTKDGTEHVVEEYGSILKQVVFFTSKDFEKTTGFIILRHMNSSASSDYWYHSYEQIRKFYGSSIKIVVIDDNSHPEFLLGQTNLEREKSLVNCFIKHSEFPKRGEVLPYYYLLKENYFEKAVIIHDSVFIRQFIDFEQYDEVKFFWHFEKNWDDPDLEKSIIRSLDNSQVLIDTYNNRGSWTGCFGAICVVERFFLQKIDEVHNFKNFLTCMATKADRIAFERIFGVLCHLHSKKLQQGLQTGDISIYGNIHDYIQYGYSYENYLHDLRNDTLRPLPVIKVWSGR